MELFKNISIAVIAFTLVILTVGGIQSHKWDKKERFVICTNNGFGESCYTSKFIDRPYNGCVEFINEDNKENVTMCGSFHVFDNNTIYTPQE